MKKIEIEIPEGKEAKWVDGVLTLVDEKLQDITERIQVGGQDVKVEFVETIEGGSLGECMLGSGYIKIANNAKGYSQTDTSKLNTFIHECVHLILDAMGECELSGNERFVNSFAGYATEIIRSIIKQKEQ